MSQQEQAALVALESLKAMGAQKAQAFCTVGHKHELNFQHGELSLMRTTVDYGLSLSAIRENRRAQLSLNQIHKDAIHKAGSELLALCEAGGADPAFGIAPMQAPKSFASGPSEPDLAKMKERLSEFLSTTRERYPSLILEEGYLAFNRGDSSFVNTNGVHWNCTQGQYSFFTVFTAKEGTKMSSFNYTMGNTVDLSRPVLDCFGIDELLEQSTGQLEARSIAGKFTGEIILTPHCLRDMLEAYFGYLTDAPMVSGTSVLKGRLGDRIASPLLSLLADPRASDVAAPEFFDGDGFETQSMPIFDKGVLKTYLLSLYGANKTGLPRALNSGGRFTVASGETSRAALQGAVRKGILLTRFSGGRPALNGDFSGVAKNSYYVENGEIRHALAETMVSGNLLKLFEAVSAVSQESLAFGGKRIPWLLSSGVTISGK